MWAKELRWLFLAVLAVTVFVASLSEPVRFGISQQRTNGTYSFAAGTHPVALTLALVVTVLYTLLVFAPPADLAEPLPGVLRRFLAFWIDFFLAMIVIAPSLGIPPIIVEWRRTGSFQWNFERAVYAPGDGWLTLMSLLLGFAGLLFYYTFPLLRRRPTPGGCITGYQIVPDDGITMNARTAILRTLVGFIATSGAYVAPFIARDRTKGKFWLDAVFGTRALKLR